MEIFNTENQLFNLEDLDCFVQSQQSSAEPMWHDQQQKDINNIAVASATIGNTLGRIAPASATSPRSNLPPSKDYVSIGCYAEKWENHGDNKETFKCNTIVFTCFDKSAIEDPESWLRTTQKNCSWILGQLEKCKTTGRIHIQGMAYSGKDPSRWGFLKGQNTWKRKCICPLKSIDYCSKSDTKLEGPWEFGDRPKFAPSARAKKEKNAEETKMIIENKVADLCINGDLKWKDYLNAKKFKTTIQADIKIAQQTSAPIDHNMDHLWIYGKTGTGKTTMARTQYPDHYLKNKNKWWDDYAGQETVIIEDLGKSDATWIGDKLKEWADKWAFKAEIKGGQIEIRPKRIVVTSNYQIEDLWEDDNIREPLLRRFKLINL